MPNHFDAVERSVRALRLMLSCLGRPQNRTGPRLWIRVHIEPLQPRLFMSVTSSGSETLVNTTTTSAMVMPAVAMNPAGNSVVVWTTTASGGEVLAQRCNITGARVGSQFQADQNPAGTSATASVAMDDVGDFVIVWINGASVHARVFNSTGAAVTSDTLITNSAVGSSRPVVAMNATGAFTIAWEGSGSGDSDGIFKQQFLLSGIATGSAVLVNSTVSGSQTSPAIAEDSAGDTIIAWTDNSTSVSTVPAAYFAASGSEITQFAAGAETGLSESTPSVGISSSGGFIIAWTTNFGFFTGDRVTARAFSSSGAAQTSAPFVVDSYAFGTQFAPTVAARADGSYLIAFTSNNQDGSGNGVYAQAYTSGSALDGNELLVNTTTSGNQQDPAAVWTGGTAMVAWDGNGTGDSTGVFLQRYTTTGSANQAPVNTVPTTQSIYVNSNLTFSSANGNAISIADADADGGVEQVTLTSANGTLGLSEMAGLTFSSGGSGTAAMTFSGTLASINSALSGMVFTPTASYVGSASVTLLTNDLGNTGVGGPASATSSVSITVQAKPTSNTVPGAQTTLENVPLVFGPQNDNSIFAGSASTSVGLSVGSGTLTLSTTSGIGFINGTANGSSSVQFDGTIAAINAALNGLTFTPPPNFTGSDPLTFITAISSGNLGTQFSTYSVPISVTAPPPHVNQPPAIAVPGTQTTGENSPVVFGSGNAITVSDSDSGGNPERLTLSATNGTLTLSTGSGLTFSTGAASDSADMTFTGTLANINAALNGLTFTPTNDFYGSGGVYAAIDDLGNSGTGGALTTVATIPITVSQVNQAPVLTVPGTQSDSENQQLSFSSANSNTISLSDVDSDGGQEQLALSTANGTLQLASSSGLSITAGGSGQSSITFRGTLANINADLQTLSFVPTSGFVGSASVQLNANDLGNSGPGGGQTASATIPVLVIQSLVVTTASDVADGNTSSVANLLANPGADGKISLREAILAVNNTPGTFAISFDIPGSGVQTVTLASALPAITRAMTINGESQPGYAGAPLIRIDGSTLSGSANGLTVQASGSAVMGVDIVGFGGSGIEITNASNIAIEGNDIGMTTAGISDPNGIGIALDDSAHDSIGGSAADDRNIISGNDGIGIRLQTSTGVVIQNNYVGCSTSTTTYLPNIGDGIDLIDSSNNTIGGAAANDGNAINANAENGITIDSESSGNVVQGNSLQLDSNDGIDVAGADNTIGGIGGGNIIDLNAGSGIQLESTAVGNVIQGNQIGSNSSALGNQENGITVDGAENTIGGAISGEGNQISGNIGYGIEITGPDSEGNLLQGNFIGTNSTGASSLTNGEGGVYLFQTTGTMIGGTAPGAGNLISGNNDSANSADGILIQDGSANTIQGNLIGTDVTGTLALGNDFAGIEIEASADNVVGGAAAGAGNTIANNTDGVDIHGSGAIDNSIRGNSIFGNSSIAINLQNNGINTGTLNSAMPNQDMNDPAFTVAALEGNSIELTGYVGTAAGQSVFAGAIIDVYLSAGSVGNGQGKTFLGSLTADGNGNFSGSISAPSVADGDIVTATATNPAGSTSEFSGGTVIQQVNQAPALSFPASQSMGENTSLAFSSDNGDALSAADIDADGGTEQATLSIGSGSLTLFATTGITLIDGTSNGTHELIFHGSIGSINAALDGLTYTPPANFSGQQTLSFSVDDLGNTGSGGAQTTSVDVPVHVYAVANTPSVTNATTMLDTQTTSGLVITPNMADGLAQGFYQITNIHGGTLYLGSGTTPITDGQFITFSQGLAGLKFTPAENSTAEGMFTVQAASSPSAGGLVGSAVTATITIEGIIINAPGLQTIPQDESLQLADGAGNSISVIDTAVGSGAITVDLSSSAGVISLGSMAGITIDSGANGQSSIDLTGTIAAVNAALDGLSISYANHFAGTDELSVIASDPWVQATAMVPIHISAVAHTPSVTDAMTQEQTLSSTGLVIAPNAIDAGEQIYFQITHISGGSLFLGDGLTPVSNGEFITAAQGEAGLRFLPALMSAAPGGFDVQASLLPATGGLGGAVVPAEIEVIPPTAPVNEVPTAQTTLQNTPLVFSSATGNAISISNSDGNAQQVSISATDGTLSLSRTLGLLMVTSDDGSRVVLSGPSAAINTALDGLTFTPTAGYNGSAQIQVVSTDVQSIELGEALSATSTIPISITAIPVTPTGPTVPVLLEDTGLTLTAGSSATIASSELDAEETGTSADQISFTLTTAPTAGRLMVAGEPLAVGASFTQDQIDQGELTYESTGTGKGVDSFSFVVSDGMGNFLPVAAFAIHTVAPAPAPEPPSNPVAPPSNPIAQPNGGDSTNLIPDGDNTTIQTPAAETNTEIGQAEPAVEVIQASGGGTGAPAAPPPLKAAAPAPTPSPQKSAPPAPAPVSTATPVTPPAPVQAAIIAPPTTLANARTFKAESPLWHDLDVMQQKADAEHTTHVRIFAGTATLVSTGMSLVYFVWAIRAGSILSSLLSSMPAWKLVDPLPILDQASDDDDGDDDDNESLQSMVEQPRRRAA